jgi:hypothetical protein
MRLAKLCTTISAALFVATAAAAAPPPIKIGISLSLTGDFADPG